MNEDTIAAIATPVGSGGIGIIRMSGPESINLVSGLFGRTTFRVDKEFVFESHKMVHGYIFERESGFVLDEVLVVAMMGPRSYTGEDVVEIQSHSGPFVMKTILHQVLLNGARLAEPGEFTRRAFLNGRIDLTQAESVADIINAKTAGSLKIAASQNTGALRDLIENARNKLISLLAQVESAIDFPDETESLISLDQSADMLETVISICRRSIQRYEEAHFLRDGIKLVICGAPNVGKSSLMNSLLERDRAIVTSVPGTTRDLLEENITINGIPFLISDTAGLHQTDDLVEKIGIERAKKHIKEADLILYMKDSRPCDFEKDFAKIISFGRKIILVINKIDLAENWKDTGFREKYREIPCIGVSALENRGIEALRQMITRETASHIESSSSIVPNLRHKMALEQALDRLVSARNSLKNNVEAETLAIDIREGADCLGMITGNTAGIDILDTIFKNFCIGK
ncbi:MAG: tRNA uridine-5-carboxymethylaminomethyl(34) synthesis GTPase MnmE [Desulfobacteraceae bacterium]